MVLLVIDPSHTELTVEADVACRIAALDGDDLAALGDPGPVGPVDQATSALIPEQHSVLLYTSGTTSSPKGALHSHASLVSEGRNVTGRLGLNARDRFWTPLPLFHCGGYCTMVGSWAAGATFVHPGAFDAGVALDQLEGERATHAFPAFETIWLAVLDHPRYETSDLSELGIVVNVGVPERLRRMQERMDAIQISSFGSTETCGFMCLGLADDPLDVRVTTSGTPLPGMELRIVDPETGEDLGPDEVGEALFRGVTCFTGYHRDPEYTAKVIDADGWFHSGDLLSCDATGRVSFRGRVKDMLKVGGENVSPAEIEDFLATHPAVQIVQVVGARDARYIEVPAAFVQLAPGANVTEQELIDMCLGVVSTFKVPRYVRFVDEWPMSGTKVQKFRLREAIERELDEAGIAEAPRLSSRSVAGTQ
jgi:fatty-acyl-CoA synthase